MINIKTYSFGSLNEFGYELLGAYEQEQENDDFEGVNVVAHYETMVNILNWIIKTTSFEIFDVKICSADIDGYAGEYILTISHNEKIWCQEAKYDDEYIYVDDVFTFVHSDCNSKFIVKNAGSRFCEFDIKN